MAKMMRRNFKRGVHCRQVWCCCGILGRAGEKRQWRLQIADDIGDARSDGICTYDHCTEKERLVNG